MSEVENPATDIDNNIQVSVQAKLDYSEIFSCLKRHQIHLGFRVINGKIFHPICNRLIRNSTEKIIKLWKRNFFFTWFEWITPYEYSEF